MRTTRIIIVPALILILLPPLSGEVKLAGIFGDNMVLQQDARVRLWGWCDPGEKIRIKGSWQWLGQSVRGDEQGRWHAQLATPAAGGPYTLVFKGQNRVELSNILIGEVWFCSGQSNMEMGVGLVNNFEAEYAAARFPQIRIFDVEHVAGDTSFNDIQGVWKVCSPQTLAGDGWEGFSATAYFFGRSLHQELGVPVGLIDNSWGATRIEPWTPPEGFQAVPELLPLYESRLEIPEFGVWAEPQRPTSIYNGMVEPMVPFTIKGALWYQGESNVGEGMLYRKKMEALITGWRTIWGQGDFPFYYVQIAPWEGYQPGDLPQLWQAQLAALSIPNTGIALTQDIGDLEDIHPKNKQEVGRRLALLALANTYGRDVVAGGPVYSTMELTGAGIRLTFDHSVGGLSATGEEIRHFTIAGEDRRFVPAQAVIDGQTIVLSSDQVANPIAVRFGWSKDAITNVHNSAGLPLTPFKTDDWD